jgi:hypothetical protein
MTSSSDPRSAQAEAAKKHATTFAALEKSSHATIVPVVPQAWVLDAKGLAAVKSALRR